MPDLNAECTKSCISAMSGNRWSLEFPFDPRSLDSVQWYNSILSWFKMQKPLEHNGRWFMQYLKYYHLADYFFFPSPLIGMKYELQFLKNRKF